MPTSPNTTLHDFEQQQFKALGRERAVYYMGAGPSVLILTEMPSITPSVADFARTVAARGFRVAMPHLFGVDGQEASNASYMRSLAQVCVSREFVMFATDRSSPITKWLNQLAQHEHEACGGPGVGVIGMCFTGGFALAMMIDPLVIAPVLSQPSLPAKLSKKSKAGGSLGLSLEEIDKVRQRAQAGQCVLGLRFTEDPLSPAERFVSLRALLGDRFIGVEIDSSQGNEWGYEPSAHSVLTNDLGTNPDSPTHRALEQVLTFLKDQLVVT